MSVTEKERQKYADVWQQEEYHEASPGAMRVDMFMQMCRPKAGASIIDIGAGAGAASRVLADRGFRVTGFDLTPTAWAQTGIPLITGSVWDCNAFYDVPEMQDFAYCCDMMEHLPTEYTALAVANMLTVAREAFLSICFVEDQLGKLVGQPLHLTVKPFVWWRDMLGEVGSVVAARDLFNDGVFHVRAR